MAAGLPTSADASSSRACCCHTEVLCRLMKTLRSNNWALECSGAGRHLYNLVTGFALLYYVFGSSTLFLLVPAVLTYLIMLGVRESCATLVWLVVFSIMVAWCALGCGCSPNRTLLASNASLWHSTFAS